MLYKMVEDEMKNFSSTLKKENFRKLFKQSTNNSF